jgi:uncharacterized protein involved in outer membrane biogenesis
MKVVKKILIGFGIFILVLVAAAIVVPIVFKDDIKAAIDKEIAKSVNADVVFDVNNFSLTVFKNFPNVTVQIKELGVFNRAPFEGVPLFVVRELNVELNLKEVIFGEQLRIKGITLNEPQIMVKVLADGKANYDITYPSADTAQVATDESGSFSFAIDHWQIVNGEVVYDDKSIPFYMALKGLNHTGSGDFNEKEFDLNTKTSSDTLVVAYDGTEYLSNKSVVLDMVLGISEDYTKYTFKENTTKLNDFAMSFNGWFKMNEKDYGMDITFSSPENSFKSILSLVPGMYTKDFNDIETKGDLSFNGFVKGTYSDTQMPAFNLAMLVKDAMFHYPGLPTSVNNINMDLLVDNKTGVIDNTVVDLKKLHLDFGTNPVDAKLLIENLKDYRMDGTLAAKLNLAELSKMFPLDGLELKGIYTVNAKAKGIYDSIRKIIPAVDANMTLANGYVKSKEFPLPLDEMKVTATVKNTSGKMAETVINVSDFSMMMDGERFSATLLLQNLDDYTWDLKANGGVDIEKMTKIFPVEGMTLTGKVKANLETKGKMSDVDAKRYDRLPTSGSASLTNFKYSSKDLPYEVTISQAQAVFDPKKVELKNTVGTIGKSDFTVNGSVTNYIGYVLHPNEIIKGSLDFRSTLLDLNEFMTETEETTTASDTTYSVIPVPQNVEFTLSSNINTVKMMDYTMTNATGDIVVKDGVANLSGIHFTMLGGAFTVNGTYNTKDIAHPKYNLGLKIDGMSIQQAATSFSVVKAYAPIAGLVVGKFSTDFQVDGELGHDMSPKLNTVNGAGLLKVAQAALTQSKFVSGLTSLTKLEDTDQVTLKDVLMSAAISDGRLSVKPFDVKLGNYMANVAGSSGLDKSVDYTLKMTVPAGKLGSQVQSQLNQLTGASNSTSEIPVTIAIGGNFLSPTFKLSMAEQKQQVKEAATKLAEDKSKEALEQLSQGAKPEDVVKSLLKSKKDTVKNDTAKAATPPPTQTPAEQATEVLQNKLNNLLKKKK